MGVWRLLAAQGSTDHERGLALLRAKVAVQVGVCETVGMAA